MRIVDRSVEVFVLKPVFSAIFLGLAFTFSKSIEGFPGFLVVLSCTVAAFAFSKDVIFEVSELLDLF